MPQQNILTMKTKVKFKSVDEYISAMPEHTKDKLHQMRSTIKKAAPKAEEVISYNMPAYKLNGMLVYYAAYNKHIGFYPMAAAIQAFKKELSGYKGAKGSIQFPINEPLPLKLISKIVKYRIKENLEKASLKNPKR